MIPTRTPPAPPFRNAPRADGRARRYPWSFDGEIFKFGEGGLTYRTEGTRFAEPDSDGCCPFCCKKARSVCFWAKKTAAETSEPMHVVFQLGVNRDLGGCEVYFRDEGADTYFGAHFGMFGTGQDRYEVSADDADDVRNAPGEGTFLGFNYAWHHYCAILSDSGAELTLSVDGAKVKTFWELPQFDTEPSVISVGRVLGPRRRGRQPAARLRGRLRPFALPRLHRRAPPLRFRAERRRRLGRLQRGRRDAAAVRGVNLRLRLRPLQRRRRRLPLQWHVRTCH